MVRHFSRIMPSLAVAALVAATLAAQNAMSFRDKPAEELFQKSRLAVAGTPNAVIRIKSLVFKGKSRLPAADGSMLDAAVEIKILLPDHYLRTDTMSSGERLEGYAGSKVLNIIRGGGRSSAPPEQAKPQLLKIERADLARLMLGAATWVSTEQPMTFFSRGTPVEMPGKAEPLGLDVIDDRGLGFVRFYVDADTKMPARLVFWNSDRTVLTITYTDRRAVDGFQLPHHITTSTAPDRVVDELIFDEIVVNPPLTKAEFGR